MRRSGPLIAGIFSLVLAVLAVVLVVLPKMNQVNDAREELQEAEQQQSSLEAQLRALQEAQQNAPELQKQLDKLARQVPPTVDLPGVIRLISSAADSSGIDFFSIAPGTPATDATGGFTIIPTQIVVNGEFFSLDEFLFRLETLPRAAKVIQFEVRQGEGFVNGGADEPLELQITLTAEFYTTDSSAGPGSIPGPTEGVTLTPGGTQPSPPAETASPSPTAGESPAGEEA